MAIDWSATGAMLSGIGSVLSAVAVIVAALFAGKELGKLRAKRAEERREDHAQACLAAANKVKWAIRHMRAPTIRGEGDRAAQELEMATPLTPQDGDEKAWQIARQVYANRATDTAEAPEILADCVPLAGALFSKNVVRAMEDLIEADDVCREYLHEITNRDGDPVRQVALIRIMQDPDPNNADNRITSLVNKALKELKSELEPILRGDSKNSPAKP